MCEPERPRPVRQVIESFAAARLMVTGPPAPTGPPEPTIESAVARDPAAAPALTAAGTVELAHDVLVSAWPRLRTWVEDDVASRILLGEITTDAEEWARLDRHDSVLYRGPNQPPQRRRGSTGSPIPIDPPSCPAWRRSSCGRGGPGSGGVSGSGAVW
ncbi:hypothetical protein ACFQX6_13295 [Streptosporangium lutulentum]